MDAIVQGHLDTDFLTWAEKVSWAGEMRWSHILCQGTLWPHDEAHLCHCRWVRDWNLHSSFKKHTLIT